MAGVQKVVMVGSSGHAGVIAELLSHLPDLSLSGVIDDFRAPGEVVFGVPVLGALESLPDLAAQVEAQAAIVAVGDNFQRRRLQRRASALCPHLLWPAVVHPTAIVARATDLGPGAVVLAGAVVQNGARLGAGTLMNTRASLDHDSVLEDFASLAPGAVTGGRVVVGNCRPLAWEHCFCNASRSDHTA